MSQSCEDHHGRSELNFPIFIVSLRFQSYLCDGLLQDITSRLPEITALSRGCRVFEEAYKKFRTRRDHFGAFLQKFPFSCSLGQMSLAAVLGSVLVSGAQCLLLSNIPSPPFCLQSHFSFPVGRYFDFSNLIISTHYCLASFFLGGFFLISRFIVLSSDLLRNYWLLITNR